MVALHGLVQHPGRRQRRRVRRVGVGGELVIRGGELQVLLGAGDGQVGAGQPTAIPARRAAMAAVASPRSSQAWPSAPCRTRASAADTGRGDGDRLAQRGHGLGRSRPGGGQRLDGAARPAAARPGRGSWPAGSGAASERPVANSTRSTRTPSCRAEVGAQRPPGRRRAGRGRSGSRTGSPGRGPPRTRRGRRRGPRRAPPGGRGARRASARAAGRPAGPGAHRLGLLPRREEQESEGERERAERQRPGRQQLGAAGITHR